MITEAQKRDMKNWRTKKVNMGWKWLNILLPPDVKDKVLSYKRHLMVERKTMTK